MSEKILVSYENPYIYIIFKNLSDSDIIWSHFFSITFQVIPID